MKSFFFCSVWLLFGLFLTHSVAFGQIPTNKKILKKDIENADSTQIQTNSQQDTTKKISPSNAPIKGRGQGVLDDTTKLIYGAFTTFHYSQQDWFEISNEEVETDTSLLNFHRYNFVAQNEFLYHDLANVGTAINPIFFQMPDKIGYRLGLEALDPYLLKPDQVTYYNTRSPYSDWYYAQGGSGRAVVDINMSQNIKPNWNAGFRYFRLSSRFLLGQRPRQRNNLHAQHESFHFHTNFKTLNNRYRLMAHVTTHDHQMQESGGLDLGLLLNDTTDVNDPLDLFEPENRNTIINRLSGVNSGRNGTQLHLYHQISLFDSLKADRLQLFHSITRYADKLDYSDISLTSSFGGNSEFYPFLFTSGTETNHKLDYQERENQLGIKGKLDELFWAFYLKHREIRYNYTANESEDIPQDIASQSGAGFQVNYALNRDTIRNGTLLRFKGEAIQTGDYRLEGQIQNNLLTGKYIISSYQPTQMQTFYFGDLFRWNNEFDNTVAQQAFVQLRLPFSEKVVIAPFAESVNLENYVYYNQEALPVESENALSYQQLGVDFHLQMGNFHHVGKFIYTNNNNPDILRMPEMFANYQVYLEKFFFQGATYAQVGFDFHWNSAFLANGYMPATQQFHLQDEYEVGDYLMSDVFVNFRLQNVRMFFKLTNVFQNLVGLGYYVTPGYMAQPREIEFGVRWLLFD